MKAEIKRLIVDCKHGPIRRLKENLKRIYPYGTKPSVFILDIGKSLTVVITTGDFKGIYLKRPTTLSDIYAANQQTLIKLCILDFKHYFTSTYYGLCCFRILYMYLPGTKCTG